MASDKEKAVASPEQILSQPAHTLSPEDACRELSVDPEEGLFSNEAKARLEKYGLNELQGGEGVSMVKIVIRQIANAMMLVRAPLSLSPLLSRSFLGDIIS